MTDEELGELLFSRYAYPCAWGRLVLGKIDQDHFDCLTEHAKEGTAPNRQILRYCYPHAFRRLREYAKTKGLIRWSKKTVADFWHNAHGHHGDCRVIRCKVIAANNGEEAPLLSDGNRIFPAVNFFRLALFPDDRVFIHHRVIVEKE